ncbi:PREDICTED: uncharacterized protein LOC105567056, partial [Vollenhovia emeryi]|uniref:uncharacterized protein LOC105567056 n=1 Tax=Vollenhovia emeryi TaxID=411798 RepID=UPI0005F366C4
MDRLRYKGRFISKKQRDKRLKAIEHGKSLLKPKKKVQESDKECIVEGLRLCDLKVIARYLYCICCQEILSLENIEREEKRGLASIFSVRCHKCLHVNIVPTGKPHEGPSGKPIFDVNTKAVLGSIHAGLGCESINKFLQVIDVPGMSSRTFKKHEREIGPVVEEIAKASCKEACNLERSLTLKNLNHLEKLFETNNNNDNIVRVFAAYDMGWSRRSNGRQYDSLNGYGSLIGKESGLVLDFATKNRKCRRCDIGHEPSNHDCRKNFQGSAKAMEPDAAVDLCVKSSILKENNIQVGVFIGDNDSSSICAVQKQSTHNVVKQSDKNHTAKGVKNLLYKIDKNKDPNREMTSEAIKYFHRCFTYAMAQHQGNTEDMAKAIRNIPYHAFNYHENCGEWCGYVTDKENYNHRTVIGGFTSPVLFEELKTIFNSLAINADKFSAGASSQANESLNGIMSKKAPKSHCYSLSESADFRFASAVLQKNKGEQYVADVLHRCNINPSCILLQRIKKVSKQAHMRSLKAKTRQFKQNRRSLQRRRLQLKTRKEKSEGPTYESHIDLLTKTSTSTVIEPQSSINNENTSHCKNKQIIYFDLETSGFASTCDILQIAMKCNEATFNMYITPTKWIPAKVSAIHGLTNEQGELYKDGVKVKSFPLRIVVDQLLQYLKNIGRE